MSLSLADAVTAYRKAKFDLFYSSDPRRDDIVAYEEELEARLADLVSRVNADDESWVTDSDFVGNFTFVPKKLSDPPKSNASYWSDPKSAWRRYAAAAPERPVAEFRLMSFCSVDFHVFSTAWMLLVGTQLDGHLSESAMGSRLRRSPFGGPNDLGSGTFLPYQGGYQKWRDGGLNAMTAALDESRSVIALTADVTSFYHQLNPEFLLDERFVSGVLHADLTPFQVKLTRLFVAALQAWSRDVAVRTGWQDRGLPVGLPASAVVANLALAELDVIIRDDLQPVYYGRYVDDILLVLDDPGDTDDQVALWRWILERSRGILVGQRSPFSRPGEEPDNAIKFAPPYLESSQIVFENAKNKTFHLSGKSGRALIDSIRETIRERNSEWRSLVNVPGNVDLIAPAITSVRRSDGDAATTLRDADQISARKLSFSVRLRDFESFERNLPPQAWADQRHEFFRVTCEQVLVLPTFFDLSKYVPRLVSLAASCGDTRALAMLFSTLAGLPDEVRATCRIGVAAYLPASADAAVSDESEASIDLVLDRWVEHLVDQVVEYLVAAWRGPIDSDTLGEVLRPVLRLAERVGRRLPSPTSVQRSHRKFAQRDLAHRPYRWTVLQHSRADKVRPAERARVPIHPTLASGLDLLVNLLRRRPGKTHQALELDGNLNAGLAFATRPPSAMELFEALPVSKADNYGVVDGTWVSRILHATRGHFGSPQIAVERRRGWPTVVRVDTDAPDRPVRVALSMLETSEADAEGAAVGSPNLTIERLNHLRRLLDAVANHRERPDYVLLPELAMPADWFPEFARGLRRSGISLVSGVEYQPVGKDGVANQVWAALRLDGWGLPFFLYKQDKQRPAKPELDKLLAPNGKVLKPSRKWRVPPVLEHGDFRFSLLICSELTNIAYRSHLRGAVDALLVPEWNQDLHWFEAVVESAALDLHAYIGQANTRGHGDTRLRAPMKDDWDRDVVRLKGGLHDYFVVGHIDVETLRVFQGADGQVEFMKPRKNLKPLPDGFKMDPQRRP